MISRRSLLAGILASASAPALVRASSLMKIPVKRLESGVLVQIHVVNNGIYYVEDALFTESMCKHQVILNRLGLANSEQPIDRSSRTIDGIQPVDGPSFVLPVSFMSKGGKTLTLSKPDIQPSFVLIGPDYATRR